MSEAAELYERDFYAWTQAQAAALRAWPEGLRPNTLDIAHIAEEIEDLGASQRSAVANLLRQILLHLLKLRVLPDPHPRSHWRREVNEFRTQLEQIFDTSPSLRSRRAELAAPVWRRAARQLARDLADEGQDQAATLVKRLEGDTPYFDLDREVLDPDWFPPAL